MIDSRALGSTAHLPCGWFAIDGAGCVIAANAALARMLGCDEAALLGRPIESLFTLESRVLYLSHAVPMLKLRGELSEVMLTLAGEHGPVDALVYARREQRDGGEAASEFVIARLHERKRLEDQLLTARRAAEQVPGIVFQCLRRADGGLAFPYMTEVVRVMYGLAPVQLRADGRRLFDAIEPAHRAAVLAAMAASAETLQPWRAEYRVEHPVGVQRWHEVNATPRRQPDGSVIWHGFIADVTERRALADASQARQAAETASRAKSDFLARVSHELRTPLNGILGFAQLLLVGSDALTVTQRRHLGHIEQAGRHLLLLINDMLDITRIEAGKVTMQIEPVEALDALADCHQLVAPLASKAEVELQLDTPCSCVVLADRNRLRQALLNLASNAVKYGAGGGVVTLALRPDGGSARLEVIDRGPGLTPEQIGALFQPFNRLGAERGPVEGTGLGLVITRGLVELMGGRLEVASQPGAGCTFAIVLPSVGPDDRI
ncbi:PAS domain-containing sensor histidine kinase [Derxia gummosa]|uniref:histidine kinase n=1 Tax=Derxia gummosa DSM 723 TaxID=1121388 RepID=A0A8B6X9A1_9BURK|nr:PAS domain-containing sensor histidine kinase [Derxia gummosa]